MMPIITYATIITLTCYGISAILAAYRLFIGPASQDRVLAADFIYNIFVLCMLVLGIYYSNSIYFEVAFMMILFSFVSSSCMAKFLIRGEVIE